MAGEPMVGRMTAPGGAFPPGVPMPSLPQVLLRPETYAGVRTYKMNLVLDLVFSGFALTIALVAIFVSTSDPIQGIALGSIIGAAACGLVIVFIINFIMSLLAVMKMHHGAREYGAEHERSASRGVMFKWLGTAMSTTAAVLVVFLLLSGSLSAILGQGTSFVYVPLLITIFWTAGVTFKGQMYRSMVRVLQPAEIRRWSDVASLVIPALGVLGIAAVGVATVRLQAALADPLSVTSAELGQISQLIIGGIFLPPGLALFGYILFLVVYSRTEALLEQGLYRAYGMIGPPFGWPASPSPGPAVAYPTWVPPNPPPAPAPSPPGPSSIQPRADAAPSPSARTCPSCGHSIPAASAYCPDCGARLPG
jgi:hypothetical protein